MTSLTTYKYELPAKPLEIRAGYNFETFVGWFHILGMPDTQDKADLGYTDAASFVLVSDATKTGCIYPAMYNPEKDTWQIISAGNQYKDGQIIKRLELPAKGESHD